MHSHRLAELLLMFGRPGHALQTTLQAAPLNPAVQPLHMTPLILLCPSMRDPTCLRKPSLGCTQGALFRRENRAASGPSCSLDMR